MLRSPVREKLTKSNSEMVYSALRKARRPLTAYEVLDQLRDDGISGPPTVYRALDKLIADGRVHKLESLNAFVLCNHSHADASAAFAICRKCGTVAEFPTTDLSRRAPKWAKEMGFIVEAANFEIHGQCANCSDKN